MMKVCTLASSSKGNSTLVMGDETIILIDAGLVYDNLKTKLKVLGVEMEDITAILSTHEHLDHTKCIGTILRRHKTHLYVHADGCAALLKKIGKVNENLLINFYDMPFELGEFTITPFRLPHDSCVCYGYSIEKEGKKISLATDLGFASSEVEQQLYDSRLVILESNHDEQMLIANPKYTAVLKQRILSKRGHLSNRSAAMVVSNLAQHNVKQVVLAHLSEENNTPELAYKTICEYLSSVGIDPLNNIKIDVASPSEIGTIFNIK